MFLYGLGVLPMLEKLQKMTKLAQSSSLDMREFTDYVKAAEDWLQKVYIDEEGTILEDCMCVVCLLLLCVGVGVF